MSNVLARYSAADLSRRVLPFLEGEKDIPIAALGELVDRCLQFERAVVSWKANEELDRERIQELEEWVHVLECRLEELDDRPDE